MPTIIDSLGFEVDSSQVRNADRDLDHFNRTAKQTDKSSAEAKASTLGLADSFKRLILPIGAVVGAYGGFNKLISEGRNLAVFNAGLETATGSVEGATAAFQQLQKFASETPYVLGQSIDAFVKLKNLGLDPSIESLRSYGNTASAMGKDLNQMIEAVADATVGEFERLKEFGIRASSEGNKVSFTFQGVTTTIGKNAQEIEAYLKALGENNFADAMAKRMDTLDGALSNLQDSWDNLYRTVVSGNVGSFIEGSVKAAIVVLNDLSELIGGDNISVSDAPIKKLDELTESTLEYASAWERVEKIRFRVAQMEKIENSAVQQTLILTKNQLEEEISTRDRLLQKIIEMGEAQTPLESKITARGTVTTFDEEMKSLQDQQEEMINLNKFRNEASVAMFEDEMREMQKRQDEIIKYNKQEIEIERQKYAARISMAQTFFSGFAALAYAGGKKTFDAYKAFAIAETIVSTYAAAQQAYHSQFLPFPDPSSPARGAIAAAGAIASGLARVASIKSQTPSGGGSTSTPGGGGYSGAAPPIQSTSSPFSTSDQQQKTTNIFRIQIGNRVLDEIVVEGVQQGIDNQTLLLKAGNEWVEVNRG